MCSNGYKNVNYRFTPYIIVDAKIKAEAKANADAKAKANADAKANAKAKADAKEHFEQEILFKINKLSGADYKKAFDKLISDPKLANDFKKIFTEYSNVDNVICNCGCKFDDYKVEQYTESIKHTKVAEIAENAECTKHAFFDVFDNSDPFDSFDANQLYTFS